MTKLPIVLSAALFLSACDANEPPAPSVGSTPSVTRRMSTELEVANIVRAEEQLRDFAERVHGSVESSTTHDDSAEILLLVPANSVAESRRALARVGEIVSMTEFTEDVSTEQRDLEIRARNARTKEARLRDLLATAATIPDVLAVEAELARSRQEVETLEAEHAAMLDNVEQTRLAISLRVDSDNFLRHPAATLQSAATGGLKAAWGATLVIAVLVLGSVPTLFVVVASWWLLRLVVRRKWPMKEAR